MRKTCWMGWVMAMALAANASAAEPVGFRGNGSGVYPGATPATKWTDADEKNADKAINIIWKTKMPSWSNASPAPAGDKVFTCAEPAVLICVNADDGAILWQATNDYSQVLTPEEADQLRQQREHAKVLGDLSRQVRDRANKLEEKLSSAADEAEAGAAIDEITTALAEAKSKWKPTPLEIKYRLPRSHGGTGYTTPTPVSDGRHVWTVFGNGLAACHTVGGERKWIRLVDKPTQGHGHAASPVLAGDKLIVAINSVHALDPKSGDELWTARSKARFGTPVALKVGGADAVLTAEGELIRTTDGSVALTGMGGLEFNSPATGDGMLFFVNSRQARAFKMPEDLDGKANAQEAWKSAAPNGRIYSSPVCHDGILYAISDKSDLMAIEATTGQKVLEKNLGIRGACYTSLAVAGDHLIAGSENGEIAMVKADRECEVVSKNQVDKLRSSPAVAGDRIYLRTMGWLYCIGARSSL